MTRKHTFLALLLLLFAASLAHSSNDAVALYNDGNEAYREKNWATAIECYLSAVDGGASSPKLFYNLGCAYFRAGDIGNAILWFERARMLAPRDPDIRKNLAFVRKATQDKIESIYRGTLLMLFWKALGAISFSEFWWLLLIASLIATAATIYAILQLRGYWLALVLWIVFFMLAGCWHIKGNRLWETRLAVVIAPKLDVRSAPSDDGELLFTIHGGTRLGIMEERHDWCRISIEDGHTGWASADAMESVIQ